MPKDMLDALIERLETDGDQYGHAWDEALPIFDALPLEERTQAQRQELETSNLRSRTMPVRAPHGARLASRPGARAGAGAFHG